MIRIGFDEVADLSRFTGGDTLVRTLEAVYPNKSAPKPWPGGSNPALRVVRAAAAASTSRPLVIGPVNNSSGYFTSQVSGFRLSVATRSVPPGPLLPRLFDHLL
jgi:hypothetical protein